MAALLPNKELSLADNDTGAVIVDGLSSQGVVNRDMKRVTRNEYSAEDKIRIILEGLRGENAITEICRREGLATNLYYRWS